LSDIHLIENKGFVPNPLDKPEDHTNADDEQSGAAEERREWCPGWRF